MKTVLTSLLGTAAIASGDIIHYFSNDDITLMLTVENSLQIDDTQDRDVAIYGAKMKLEVLSTAEDVRLNSVYYRMNNGSITGDAWAWAAGGATMIKQFDLNTPDFNNSISPDPNPFGSVQTNPAFRPWLLVGEGRGSYNFSDNRILQQDLDAENYWFDENVEGGDQWFLYHDEFRTGSGSIGEWTFDQPMSIVYSKSKGSTTESYAFGNFTSIYEVPDPPSEPEPVEFNFTYTKPYDHTHVFTVTDGFYWTLEASTNLIDWVEVDSPFVTTDNGDGTTSYIFTRQDAVREFFRFAMTDGSDTDLMSVARSSVMNAIDNLDPSVDQSIFNNYGESSVFERNPNNFLNGKEGITGLVAWNSRTNGKQLGGFAITPQHVISTQHAAYLPGDVVTFVTEDNVVISRTITHTKGTTFNEWTTDYVMCLLDSPLPATIKPLEIMPSNSADYFDGKSTPIYLYKRVMMVWANQYEESVVAEFKIINWMRSDDPTPNEYSGSDHANWTVYNGHTGLDIDGGWKHDATAGDSGSVPMLMLGDKLVACGLYSDETTGHWFGQLVTINDLKRLIVDVDAKANIITGLTLTEADLSDYNNYTE